MDEKIWLFVFGKRIRERMDEFELTVSELSRRTGIPSEALSRYIRGKVMPRASVIPRLAKALTWTSSDLLDFDI